MSRDRDDLPVLARRGALRETQQRELARLLAADPALAFTQRAGLECDRLAAAPGDEQLIDRATIAALQRLQGTVQSAERRERPDPPTSRGPGLGASVLSIGVIVVIGSAVAFVLGGRGQLEAPPAPVQVAPRQLAPMLASPAEVPTPTAAADASSPSQPRAVERAQPLSAAELYKRSNLARRRGDVASAEAGYRRLIQSYPRVAESRLAQLSLAKLLLARDAAEEAEAILRRSVARGAGQLTEEALVLHAASLRALERPGAEAVVWRRLLESFPASAYASQARERLAALSSVGAATAP